MDAKPHVVLLAHTPEPERIVAAASRLCYSNATIPELLEQVSQKDQAAFITRLLAMGHLSPFEHVSCTFGIEGVSRALLAQITRHRIASFSVQSQRYVAMGGFDCVVPPSVAALGDAYADVYRDQMKQMDQWYRGWLDTLGEQKKEDARFVLPNGCATRMIVTMNARELLHFFEQRCCNRAQWEIRGVAWEMLRLVREVAPALFASAGPACVRGNCSQGKMSCHNPYSEGGLRMNQSERNIPPETATKAARHADICLALKRTYIAKNADYGDSFSETYKKLGIVSAVTRISDKTSRLQSLCCREALVKDETIRDTLLDLANYAIMTVMMMDEAEPSA